ncbi:MAG TPA: cytochrome c oxidase subunit 3 [Candidatus Baltobacteraceae bacterium]|nr:cytochrome c oxidase subunit 3 [Candidatus Baltobacteraceae bacterium]
MCELLTHLGYKIAVIRHQPPMPIRTRPVALGTIIYIASETMFFSALFATYYDLKSTNAVWPPPYVHLDEISPAFGTFFLVASSLMMFPMSRAVRKRNFKAAYGWLYGAIIGGLGYIGSAMHGYASQGFNLHTSAYGSIFITMTGFHLLHVVAGVILLLGLYYGLRSPTIRVDKHDAAEAVTYYWHFVTVMWFGIYTTVYWIR